MTGADFVRTGHSFLEDAVRGNSQTLLKTFNKSTILHLNGLRDVIACYHAGLPTDAMPGLGWKSGVDAPVNRVNATEAWRALQSPP